MPWTPRGLSQSRYLVASEVSPRGVSLRPAFVGSLDPTDSPLWSDPVWRVPDGSDLVSGTALFTDEAELVGMVVGSGVERAVVPAAVLFAEVNRLLERPKAMAGVLGVEVQALTEEIASATGASGGVVVTWVDSDGAAARSLMVGDVIEAVDGRPLVSRRRWDVRVARLAAGETLTVGVRRGGELRSEALMATAPAVPATTTSLGLSLRGRTGAGAEVTRVEPGSAADRAGLEVGDRITLVGTISAPTPAQIRSAFGAAVEGQRVMIAVTRGNAHHVTTLAR
jgi:S1-C subfamily serine protease